MTATENHTINYFRAPQNYFWKWADNGAVIQWRMGPTICYKEDLVNLLQQVNSGLPPLSPLLLLLTACGGSFDTRDKLLLRKVITNFGEEAERSSMHKTLDYAIQFLEIVAALPENLRTGQSRVHLIFTIFSEGAFIFANRQVMDAIQELKSGRLDQFVFDNFSPETTEEEFTRCLLFFCTALQKYPTVQSLTAKLRTGLDTIPEPAPALLEEDLSLSLYDQLLQDPETAGIAILAKRLIAALNIPMQSKGSSDMPLGGISDISNRGNYDKLLLSELAHDDELLMARLVNNEALFFKREQPPENPKTQRIILLDTSLKMWGTARVFAIAAGLACAQQNKHSELLQAYALGGTVYTPVSLNSKNGIIQTLGMLDPALHCGEALEAALQSVPATTKNEFIFITHERLLHSAAFHASLSVVRTTLSFIITVTGSGELHLYEYINGVSKMISSARIDVDELLESGRVVKQKTKNTDGATPLFLLQRPSPLFFPAFRIKVLPEKVLAKEGFGAVAINQTQRVLFSSKREKGAVELMAYIEKGEHYIGVDSNGHINIMVNNPLKRFLKLYKIDHAGDEVKKIDLPLEMSEANKIVYKENKFYLENGYGAFVYDCVAGIVTEKKIPGSFNEVFNKAYSFVEIQKRLDVYKYFNDNEIVFYKIKNIHVNREGTLVVGKHKLTLQNQLYISFKETYSNGLKVKVARFSNEDDDVLQNKNLPFNVWTWDDGSQAVVDPRGFLHLKSSDKSLPEIAVVMVLNRVTACWASDGTCCGAPFYVNEKVAAVKNAAEFYNDYIQKFIDRLV